MIPDKDQVREAMEESLVVYAAIADPVLADAEATVRAVARAFVDGELLPAKPDYEERERRGDTE